MNTWLVTGAGGFIGSHLVETLLARKERVIGLDNFSTGRRENLKPFHSQPGFTFLEGDIRDAECCRKACAGVDFVLHQAAQCSVPASISDPAATHETNVTGFLNVLLAAREAAVKRVVFASSCAVYGDSQSLPNSEAAALNQFLSPYALSKYMDELYAAMFEVEAIGLRYFNVYGPRQDPDGPYAAVIPRWIQSLIRGEQVTIFGDGTTTRDFVFVNDVVRANLLAATTNSSEAVGQVYNIAAGRSISLNVLYEQVSKVTGVRREPAYANFRAGDIRHSSADVSKARHLLGFEASTSLEQGLKQAITS